MLVSEICDYLLDFETKLVDPTYKIKIYVDARLIRQLGAYQIIDLDLLKGYLLAMKLENIKPADGRLVIETRNGEVITEMTLDSKENLKTV